MTISPASLGTPEPGGTGREAAWQQLTKSCPAFAVEYGAVVMRSNGGRKGEFNPIRKRWAEVFPVCDAMLSQVQNLVEASPQLWHHSGDADILTLPHAVTGGRT